MAPDIIDSPVTLLLFPHSLTNPTFNPDNARILAVVISTDYFPVEHQQVFDLINRRLFSYHYRRQMNRAERRARKHGRR
jgi:hypothetical protein